MSSTLINLSGGIDSAYLLWKAATEDCYDSIIVHHCNIINNEKRYIIEKISTKNIMSWIYKNSKKRISYIETTFDYKDVDYVIRDIEIVAFMNATILRSGKYSVDNIMVSANSHDESNDVNEISVVRRKNILDLVGPSGYDSSKLLFPMLHLSKKDIIDELPKELFDLTWYCRRPIGKGSSGKSIDPLSSDCVSWVTCKICKTCRQVENACNELGLPYKTIHNY